MKRILLWWENRKGFILLDLLLLFVVTVSILTLSNAWGIYRYIALSNEKATLALESDQALYYVDFSDPVPPGSAEDVKEITAGNQARYELIQTLEQMPGVRSVLANYSLEVSGFGSSDSGFGSLDSWTAFLCSQDFQALFPDLNRGEWFDQAENPDGTFNAVLCGEDFYDVPVGSTMDLVVYENQGTDSIKNVFRIRVCGVIYGPAFLPTLGAEGTSLTVSDLYQNVPALLLGPCDTFEMLMQRSMRFQYGSTLKHFWVDFTADATPEQIQAVQDLLSQTGGWLTLSQIRQTSADHLDSSFKSTLVIPLFYVAIAFVAFFSITILSVFRRTRTDAVYYLLGYSKRRIVWSVAGHTGILILLAAGINLIYVNSYYAWVATDWIQPDPVSPPYFDAASSWLIVGIALFMFVVTLAAALGVLRKKSPSDFWLSSKE